MTRSVNEVTPEERPWDPTRMLLAEMVDMLRLLYWAKTEDGSKGRNRPDPITRPGVTPPGRTGYGGKDSALPADELMDWFAQDFEDIDEDEAQRILTA